MGGTVEGGAAWLEHADCHDQGTDAFWPPTYTRADHTDEWSKRLGEERVERAWRCRDLREGGAYAALGSDRPIAHRVARQVLAPPRRRAGPPGRWHGPTGPTALEGMTTHAAAAAGEDQVTGRITACGPVSRRSRSAR